MSRQNKPPAAQTLTPVPQSVPYSTGVNSSRDCLVQTAFNEVNLKNKGCFSSKSGIYSSYPNTEF